MSDLIIIGAGAFGTALAIAFARDGKTVHLIGRDAAAMAQMSRTRVNPRLPDIAIPDGVTFGADTAILADWPTAPVLMATPTQALRTTLQSIDAPLSGRAVVACCKGIDLRSHDGPSRVISKTCPNVTPAVLTGPSFAADIGRGLPTALTLAVENEDVGRALQHDLATPMLRLYLSTDVVGAELGGALKNVMAIACGACMGSGLGDSARAALMTRGFAEMQRLAAHFGAKAETLTGLSGFGDLALTCTSDQSRNFRFGFALGRGDDFDPSVTVEGKSTARAVAELAGELSLDLPITAAVDSISTGKISVAEALAALLSRPLKKE